MSLVGAASALPPGRDGRPLQHAHTPTPSHPSRPPHPFWSCAELRRRYEPMGIPRASDDPRSWRCIRRMKMCGLVPHADGSVSKGLGKRLLGPIADRLAVCMLLRVGRLAPRPLRGGGMGRSSVQLSPSPAGVLALHVRVRRREKRSRQAIARSVQVLDLLPDQQLGSLGHETRCPPWRVGCRVLSSGVAWPGVGAGRAVYRTRCVGGGGHLRLRS